MLLPFLPFLLLLLLFGGEGSSRGLGVGGGLGPGGSIVEVCIVCFLLFVHPGGRP